jgi:hypothetical protein
MKTSHHIQAIVEFALVSLLVVRDCQFLSSTTMVACVHSFTKKSAAIGSLHGQSKSCTNGRRNLPLMMRCFDRCLYRRTCYVCGAFSITLLVVQLISFVTLVALYRKLDYSGIISKNARRTQYPYNESTTSMIYGCNYLVARGIDKWQLVSYFVDNRARFLIG